MKQDVTISVDVPAGWELTGEFRKAVTYDHIMYEPGSVSQWLDYDPTEDAYLIARPVAVALEPLTPGSE